MSKPVRIYTVVNQKGGVGKTTTTCNLVFGAEEAGLKILVMDSDTQGNTSQFLSRDMHIDTRPDGFERVFDFFENEHAELPIQNVFGNVWLLHGHIKLDDLDRDPGIYDVYKLMSIRDRIKRYAQTNGFDRVIFDTPTALGPRQVGPMLWADVLYVPMEPSPLAISTLPRFVETVNKVRNINHALEVRYVINKIMRSKAQLENLERMRKKFGKQIIAELWNRVAVADSLAVGESVWQHTTANKELRQSWQDFTRRALELN